MSKFTEDVNALLDFGVAGGVADPEVRILFAKDIAGDDKHIVFYRLLHKVARRAFAGNGFTNA